MPEVCRFETGYASADGRRARSRRGTAVLRRSRRCPEGHFAVREALDELDTRRLELADACADAAVPQTGPLPGAYRKRALPVLERRLAEGRFALREALDELDTKRLELNDSLLVNVNTKDELRRLG